MRDLDNLQSPGGSLSVVRTQDPLPESSPPPKGGGVTFRVVPAAFRRRAWVAGLWDADSGFALAADWRAAIIPPLPSRQTESTGGISWAVVVAAAAGARWDARSAVCAPRSAIASRQP